MEALGEFDRVVHEPDDEFVEQTNVYQFMQRHGIDSVDALRRKSTADLEWFWDELVDTLDIEFYEPYDAVHDDSDAPQFSEWYKGGMTNIAHNVLDRHAARSSAARNTTACIWEGEDGSVREVSFQRLSHQSNRVANALADLGVGTGDTVGVFMPMVPEAVATMYGTLMVGAVVVPMFSGFGRDSLATRIEDAGCRVLVTADGFRRRGDPVRMKSTADEAIEATDVVEHVLVYDHLGTDDPASADRDERWSDCVETQSSTYDTVAVDANHDAFLLYSSGTTGKPKGIRLGHAGFLVQVAKEIYFGFDHKPSDRFYWVTDVG